MRDKVPPVKHWICINGRLDGWTALEDLVAGASDSEPAARATSPNDPFLLYFSFFPAEDRIRDLYVTGVQTCALPISRTAASARAARPESLAGARSCRGWPR